MLRTLVLELELDVAEALREVTVIKGLLYSDINFKNERRKMDDVAVNISITK